MRTLFAGLIIVGLIPLLTAWRANRHTSLAHALIWMIAAWLSWGIAFVFGNLEEPGLEPSRYCALCLTSCAGVAVLGARRPQFGAWNFVVLGLFAVMIWPLVETLVLGKDTIDELRMFFLAATAAVGVLNYLPTRFAPAVVWWLPTCAGEIALLYAPSWFPGQGETMLLHALVLATPWIGWLCLWQRARDQTAGDRLWLGFRDRWGLFWSQRVREQFNNTAQHAGWPVKLAWQGLVIPAGRIRPTAAEEEQILAALGAVLQRFVAKNGEPGA